MRVFFPSDEEKTALTISSQAIVNFIFFFYAKLNESFLCQFAGRFFFFCFINHCRLIENKSDYYRLDEIQCKFMPIGYHINVHSIETWNARKIVCSEVIVFVKLHTYIVTFNLLTDKLLAISADICLFFFSSFVKYMCCQ